MAMLDDFTQGAPGLLIAAGGAALGNENPVGRAVNTAMQMELMRRKQLQEKQMKERQLQMQQELLELKKNAPISVSPGSSLFRPGEEQPFYTAPTKPTKEAPAQSKGAMVDANNNFLGYAVFDPNSSDFKLWSPETGDLAEMPKTARPQTPTGLDSSKMPPKQYMGLRKDVETDAASIRAMQRYWGDRQNARQGLDLLVDQFRAAVKTLSNETGLSEQELAARASSGKVQGLLGRFREDIVGGGVMTEKDAWRVLAALGGDVNALQNKEVVAKLISDAMKEKVRSYNEKLPMLNYQTKKFYMGVYPEMPKMDFDPSVFKVETKGGKRLRYNPETGTVE